jgi:hypothetical protein
VPSPAALAKCTHSWLDQLSEKYQHPINPLDGIPVTNPQQELADPKKVPLEVYLRASGILLHPTSLPGRFGVGDLGEAAYHFVDFL